MGISLDRDHNALEHLENLNICSLLPGYWKTILTKEHKKWTEKVVLANLRGKEEEKAWPASVPAADVMGGARLMRQLSLH